MKGPQTYSALRSFLCLDFRFTSPLRKFAFCGFRRQGRIACWSVRVFLAATAIMIGFHDFL